jgi:hypothetical protein
MAHLIQFRVRLPVSIEARGGRELGPRGEALPRHVKITPERWSRLSIGSDKTYRTNRSAGAIVCGVVVLFLVVFFPAAAEF